MELKREWSEYIAKINGDIMKVHDDLKKQAESCSKHADELYDKADTLLGEAAKVIIPDLKGAVIGIRYDESELNVIIKVSGVQMLRRGVRFQGSSMSLYDRSKEVTLNTDDSYGLDFDELRRVEILSEEDVENACKKAAGWIVRAFGE